MFAIAQTIMHEWPVFRIWPAIAQAFDALSGLLGIQDLTGQSV